MILGTMTGTLFLYQGQEIGMINAPRSWPAEEYKCIKSTSYYNDVRRRTNDDPTALSKALNGMQLVARDHARVPMQWDSSLNAGFCGATAKPWMRVTDSYQDINVESQIGKESSVMEFYKQMLRLRKLHKDLFVYGKYRAIEQGDELMVFTKESNGQKSLTVANLSGTVQRWEMPETLKAAGMQPLLENQIGLQNELTPYEARVYISLS
jgi:oligo-1,6-glucosidase